MSNMTPFGRYILKDSFVHKLDPRTKLLALIAYVVALFITNSFVGLGVAVVLFIVAVIGTKISFFRILRSTRAILVILTISLIFNLFMTPGEPLLKMGPVLISMEGVKTCIKVFVRLFLLVCASSVMTFTTTPTQLTNALTSLLWPLKKIGVPVSVFAMISTIALRFIPILSDETQNIIKAQKSRGAEFESRNLFVKIKAYVSIIVPLMISSFSRADELANAMDARGYDSRSERTSLARLRFGVRDLIGLLAFVLLFGAIVLIDSQVLFEIPDWLMV